MNSVCKRWRIKVFHKIHCFLFFSRLMADDAHIVFFQIIQTHRLFETASDMRHVIELLMRPLSNVHRIRQPGARLTMLDKFTLPVSSKIEKCNYSSFGF